jgi:site-specific recombinase XerD
MGLLNSELAAGIRRVKGAKQIGVRLGSWLTAEHSRVLLQAHDVQSLKGRRNRAILPLMLGCGLRQGEVATLTIDHLQQR